MIGVPQMNSSCRNLAVSLLVQSLAVAAIFSVSPPLHAQVEAAPDQKLMQTIEDRWSDAILKRDQYGLENTLSPQFVDISGDGEITTRNQQVARLFVKDVNILELSQKVVSVRVFGETAVVTGTYTLRKKESGNTAEEKGVFTHVFGRTRSGWLCVQSQRTAIVERQAPKKVAKKSNAEEPFHIPFFHKGAESASTPTPAPAPQP
jgi:ketosteroid isomerase-like protein